MYSKSLSEASNLEKSHSHTFVARNNKQEENWPQNGTLRLPIFPSDNSQSGLSPKPFWRGFLLAGRCELVVAGELVTATLLVIYSSPRVQVLAFTTSLLNTSSTSFLYGIGLCHVRLVEMFHTLRRCLGEVIIFHSQRYRARNIEYLVENFKGALVACRV